MLNVYIPSPSQEVFNFNGVFTNKALAWEIDEAFKNNYSYMAQLLQGTNILDSKVGGYLQEMMWGNFDTPEFLQRKNEIQTLFQKWRTLVNTNQKMVEINGNMVPSSLVI